MTTFTYAAHVREHAPGDYVVRFEDIPEAITGGSTVDEAVANAPDCLDAAMRAYLKLGRPLPAPRAAKRGEFAVALDPSLAARSLLLAALADQKITKVALAARMDRDEKVVRRIVAGEGVSLDLTLAALRAVGVRPALAVG